MLLLFLGIGFFGGTSTETSSFSAGLTGIFQYIVRGTGQTNEPDLRKLLTLSLMADHLLSVFEASITARALKSITEGTIDPGISTIT